jgi:hypothetical protein
VAELERPIADLGVDQLGGPQRVVEAIDNAAVSSRDRVVVRIIDELVHQHAEVGQTLPVDAREGPRQDQP